MSVEGRKWKLGTEGDHTSAGTWKQRQQKYDKSDGKSQAYGRSMVLMWCKLYIATVFYDNDHLLLYDL